MVDWASSEKEGDKLLFVFVFVFDGGRLSDEDCAAMVLPPDELERFAFYELDEVDAYLIERGFRRHLWRQIGANPEDDPASWCWARRTNFDDATPPVTAP